MSVESKVRSAVENIEVGVGDLAAVERAGRRRRSRTRGVGASAAAVLVALSVGLTISVEQNGRENDRPVLTNDSDPAPTLPVPATPDAVATLAPAQRGPAIDLAGESVVGAPLTTHSYRGDVVVIRFWASWCWPCRRDAPALKQMTAIDGVTVLGVASGDRDLEPARRFAADHASAYDSIWDPNRTITESLGAAGPRVLPATYVLDRQGRIAAVKYGAITSRSELQEAIASIRAEAAR